MRRPLCPVLLLWIAVIWLMTAVRPPAYPDLEYAGGDTVILQGSVDNIDCWINDAGEEKRVLYLKQAAVVSDSNNNFTSNSDKYHQSDSNKTNLRLICYLEQKSELPRIGSMIRCIGRWSSFRQACNPGEFDAAAYYHTKGWMAQLNNTVITGVSREYSVYRDSLYRLRTNSRSVLYTLLPPKDASILAAMLLGEKKGMDSEVKRLYQDAGISHILAISGLHISIIGMGLLRLLKRLGLPLHLSAGISVVLLISYVVMTGISASSIRALLMFLLCIWAMAAGRTVDYPTALCVAACLILMTEPSYIYDSGFRLSFSASAGAVLVIPAFKEMKKSGRHRAAGAVQGRLRKGAVRLTDAVISAFCIGIFSLPVVLCTFYQWNWVSIGVNVLVIPLMGIVMGAGILMVFLGNVSMLFTGTAAVLPAGVPAVGVHLIFTLYEKLCVAAAACRFGKWHTGMPQMWQLFLFYVGFLLILLFRKTITRRTGVAAAAMLSLLFLIRLPEGMNLTMLDVGQGESVYLETESGSRYLTDAGSTSLSDTGNRQVVPFLKYMGVDRLEGIFVSHWDEDHINGLEAVCKYTWSEGIAVGAMYIPDTGLRDEGLERLLGMAEAYGITVRRMKAGDVIRDGADTFTCLHPGRGESVSDRNGSSAVYLFQAGDRQDQKGFSILMTGDMEAEGENWVLDHMDGSLAHCSVLKTAHHGSDTSTTQAWVNRICPDIALISCGRKNRYGHPSKTVVDRLEEAGSRVFITADSGAVTVRYRKQCLTVERFLMQ